MNKEVNSRTENVFSKRFITANSYNIREGTEKNKELKEKKLTKNQRNEMVCKELVKKCNESLSGTVQ